MNTIELLKKAREVITDPDRWVQRRYGEAEGGRILTKVAAAHRVCAVGALYKAAGIELGASENFEGMLGAKDELLKDIGSHEEEKYQNFAITEFNDQTSHEEVLALFDTTIERLEEK